MTDREKRYLAQLAREYPTMQSASAEIINLTAILNLPKGTEHFMSDIHGENESFTHILNNGSGAVAEKVSQALSDSLTAAERRALCALIYYPREKLAEVKAKEADLDEWYRVTIRRLIAVARISASKYSRSKVRKALPKEFAYILEELLNAANTGNKEQYYSNIISAVIRTDCADTFIVELSTLVKRMTVDQLHIVGDIFDRGPHADEILDALMRHHNVDIQWGNHDALWLGAAAGSPVCVATAVKNCLQYDNLDMLENGYGINMLPLAVFSSERYENAAVFEPRNLPSEPYRPRDMSLYAKMHKAVSVIMFKLEGQLVQRKPEFSMKDRDMLSRVNWEKCTIEIDGAHQTLRDTDFPTVDPKEPNRLSPDEIALMGQLTAAFRHSEKLQAHARFLCRAGSLYRCCNGNLLFHGCVPTEADGSFTRFSFGSSVLSGKNFFDYADRLARQGVLAPEGSRERADGQDFLWFLWCGRNSPVFGRDHIATFERTLLEDKATWKEPKNAYYDYNGDEEYCQRILDMFGLDRPWSRIVNGHIPVKVKDGESPLRAGGKLIVIDGGFCKAYQRETGIAGYTMFFSSHSIRLSAHEPFTTAKDAITRGADIMSHTIHVEDFSQRVMVADIDTGAAIRERIADLEKLLDAYRDGVMQAK
ncbi:MAG TPA: fructose-1,6-bisphosphatase [Clostridia bacterium]|nr:fructose-1,6-bisphosphatase [Clostridia bacterium]